MVEVHRTAEADAQFVIWPQSALDWRRMRLLLCLLTAAIAAVAVSFAAAGAWLVLPFAGLEAAVLAAAIYLNARRSVTREVISFSGAELVVSRGRRQLVEVARLSRHWARVALITDPRGWYPSRLVLFSHGRRFEVGALLTDTEREDLARRLRARLGPSLPTRCAEPAPVVPGAGAPVYE